MSAMKTIDEWSPERFREAVAASPLTFSLLAVKLHRYGYLFSESAVRYWSRDENPGPKHPALLRTLRRILPRL